ncbi:SAM-dependent methyltransferase, partial [Mesorhizobium sp. M1C.F.Ca.ET.176.01.1.1]
MSISAASMHGLGEPSPWVRHWAHLVAAGGAVLD